MRTYAAPDRHPVIFYTMHAYAGVDIFVLAQESAEGGGELLCCFLFFEFCFRTQTKRDSSGIMNKRRSKAEPFFVPIFRSAWRERHGMNTVPTH